MVYRKGDADLSTLNLNSLTTTAFATVLMVASILLAAVQTRADVVTDWNEIADTVVVTNANRPAGAALIDMAYVHAAVYDALNAIDRRHSAYAVSLPGVPRNASSKAAAATAAYCVLRILFPTQATFLETKYAPYLASIPEGEAKTNGIAIGKEVAERFMALRENDGRDAPAPFIHTSGPGAWLPTPPTNSAHPLTPWMARMRPFLIKSPSQFRAPGLPVLTGDEWARDYRETKVLGAISSTARTAEQTQIGRFYAEHSGVQYNRIFRDFAATQNLKSGDSARLFAMLYLSIADSLIASWDSKYYFAFWRPVTAIRAGETDGNNLTKAEATWTPLVVTPEHPEYPAAHGSLTAAYAETLRAFYGTKRVNITLSSTVTDTRRSFNNTDDLVAEIIDARVFGGMHYRTSGVHGADIGRKVTRWMISHYFHAVK